MSRDPTTSEWIEVQESGIHNKGIFAVKDIPKGTRIIEYVGRALTKEESDNIYEEQFEKSQKDVKEGSVYIFELNDKIDIDGNVEYNTARLINHSCAPNCESDIIDDHIYIIASKNIKKGEELGYDYGYDLADYEEHPCKCGSPNCIGYIVAQEHWPKLRRKLARKARKESRARSNSSTATQTA